MADEGATLWIRACSHQANEGAKAKKIKKQQKMINNKYERKFLFYFRSMWMGLKELK